MSPVLISWLGNTLRHLVRRGLLGGVLHSVGGGTPLTRVRVVAATRLTERDFWKTSMLGRSLATWRNDNRIDIDIAFENRLGLPSVYNAGCRRAQAGDAVLFVHDDVWLDDGLWIDKLLVALKRYDVVGLAGNTRRVAGQHSWHILSVGTTPMDFPHLSGSIGHGEGPRGFMSVYGPAPLECELVDGVFLAVRKDVCEHSRLEFDERFDFHFYDLDFCRSARSRGLKLGTWPILATHRSTGNFGGPDWKQGLQRYMTKWKS